MFTRTRRRLTFTFSIMLMAFLLSFNAIAYLLVSSIIYDQQKQRALLGVESYLSSYKEDLEHQNKEKHEEDHKKKNKPRREAAFSYLFAKNGDILSVYEVYPEAKGEIVDILKGWNPQPNEVRFETIQIPEETDIVVAIAGRLNERGTVYVGIDVSAEDQVLHQLSITLLTLSAIFILLSAVIGYYMAGRAMTPITQSFSRQRQFVADASHELRTPLSVLQSTVEVLEADQESKLPEFSRQILFDMKDEILRMNNLVGDLLTLARVDSGAAQLSFVAFDLREMLNQLLRKLQTIIQQEQLSVHVDADDALMVIADKERMLQLLFILIDNAIKYTPKGGHIFITLQLKDQKLWISVKDTGIGIPVVERKRIFARFYRIDKARSREKGGTGLGLAIADWIVQAHGGMIEVDSEVGAGSTFTVLIPQHNQII